MKAILSSLLLFVFFIGLTAQETDSLKNQSLYRQAWDTAMIDGKITDEERALMNILVESLVLAVDSSQVWETQWNYKIPRSLDQSGRWPLVMQNIAIGAGLYGWGIPYVLHADDDRWYVGGVMVSAGGAFYLTYKYTREMDVSHARTQMMRYGELLGLRVGQGINSILKLDSGLDESQEDEEDRDPETLWVWTLMASVPAGHYAGEYLFEKVDPTNGQAWVWSLWTGISGMTARQLYSAIGGRPDEPDELMEPDWDSPSFDMNQYELDLQMFEEEMERHDEEMEKWEKPLAIVELVAYPVGAVIGHSLVKNKQYSFGDAMMLMQGWSFGYMNTMMLQSIFFEDGDPDMFVLMSSLGAIGSTFAYDRWIKNDDFSFGQATLMFLGSTSGTAFGFGTGILLDVRDRESLLTLALAGYGAGTYLTRQILDVKADGSLTHETSNRISLTPTALPVLGSDQRVTLIPGLNLRVSFK
ncbi:MAG: hypothetical protein U9Q77_02625 [Candidatus Marinimicrobia bacterium]|nr:hypothetical protein [Candidatus Neomarinimicrobiota bacterium]